ncbi:hypothetical protein Sjap_002721 [Stephania japonica]|uniref:SHSP domain-containing protein n=1 Tax=Stephania japonica TaxID=461633 RepID=A0AAP0KMD6_9MAGN
MKENVKVSMEENTLMIRGEGEKELKEDQESGIRRYSSRINLPRKLFKLDQIKVGSRMACTAHTKKIVSQEETDAQ